jgi:hypothetical protein
LDAWLKDEDADGWKLGPNQKIPAISLLLRKGNPGFNSTAAEATFQSRPETEWPIARTEYRPFYLTKDKTLATCAGQAATFEIEALGKGSPLQFDFSFDRETEIAGHPTARLWYSIQAGAQGTAPKDFDVFVTLRHIDPNGKEVFYTGACSPVTVIAPFADLQEPLGILHRSPRVGFEHRSGQSTTNIPSTANGCLTGSIDRPMFRIRKPVRYTRCWLRSGRRRLSLKLEER